MKDVKSRVGKVKSTRLRFKNQKTTKPLQRDDVEPNQHQSETEDEASQQQEQQYRRQPHSNPSSHQKDDFIEWGPFINGYRFIGSKSSQDSLHYQQRHSLLTNDKHSTQSYNWSYMDLPEYKSAKDTLEEKYKDVRDDDEEFTYDDYFKEWEYIKQHGLRDIVFPIVNQNDELDQKNVRKFLQTSVNDEFVNILKIERIRWHPDKMIRTLKLDVNDDVYKQLSEKITKTFQIVNQLWEEFNSD